jgi:hypothetical protein
MTLEELRRFKPQLEAIARKHRIRDLRVFGSVARNIVHDDGNQKLFLVNPLPQWGRGMHPWLPPSYTTIHRKLHDAA